MITESVMSVTKTFAAIRALGLTVSRRNGEWKINYVGSKETTAYYCTDNQDAIDTATKMVSEVESFGKTPAPFNIANDGRQMIINMPDIPKARRTVDPHKKPNLKSRKVIQDLPPRPKGDILREALEAVNRLVDSDVELYIKDGKVKARILTFVEL